MKNFKKHIKNNSLQLIMTGWFQSFNFPIFQFSNLLILSFLIFNSTFLISQNSLDNLTYNYNANTNQLNSITDGIIGSPSVVDLEGQGGDNYAYDASGQLIYDAAEGLLDIEWTVIGKVKQVSIDDNGDLVADRTLQFKYDPLGDRVKKIETTISSGTSVTTYYIRNATGELISTYKNDGNGVERGEVAIAIGIDNAVSDFVISGVYARNVGYKNYELKDHLGSVRVSISDTKEPEPGLTTFNSQLTTSTDYQSYGALMAGRDYNSVNYQYGYQGKEKDNELKGNGNSYDFGARLLDTRVGRWLSIDPKADKFASMSPYNSMANNPIVYVDPNGMEPQVEYSWGIEMQNMYNGNLAFGNNLSTFAEGLNASKYYWENPERNPLRYLNANGDCFKISQERMTLLYRETFGIELKDAVEKEGIISWDLFNQLYAVGSERSAIPKEYRSSGSAGAMFFAGLGDLQDRESIMLGNLYPGAVMQVYTHPGGEEVVLRNHALAREDRNPFIWGHSFIFKEYVYNDAGDEIVGMNVVDQGFFNNKTMLFENLPIMWGSNIGMSSEQTKAEARLLITIKKINLAVAKMPVRKKEEGAIPWGDE